MLNSVTNLILFCHSYHSEAARGVLMKRCSENMQQIYRRTPRSKSDFNKVAKQLEQGVKYVQS